MYMISRTRRRILNLFRAFANENRGNVAIIFGFSLIPLIGLVGLGADYGVAITNKAKLDNAADAAAVSAVSTAKAYVANNQSDSNITADAIAAGRTQAASFFIVDAGNVPFATVPTPTITLTFNTTNQTFYSTVSYSTTVQNHFGEIFRQPTTLIQGVSSASAQLPAYLDFYLLVDVSGSMGLPATQAGQTTLAANNSGCQFACHFPGQTSGYTYANQNSIQLRSGAVNSAVCGLLVLASTPAVTHQYRVGLYPFITQMATLSSLTYADPAPTVLAPTSNSVWNAAGCIPNISTPYYTTSSPPVFTSLLDTGTTQEYTNSDPSTGTGSGGTHFETIFSATQNTVLHFGNGATSSTSKPFVFLITDGMQNSQYYDTTKSSVRYYPGNPSTFSGYSAAGFTGSSPTAMDYTQCTALKNAGATISVLYIPYQNLTVGSTDQAETIAANTAIANLPTALTKCATTGYFYTANTPTDINNALQNMFNQAVAASHLTQ